MQVTMTMQVMQVYSVPSVVKRAAWCKVAGCLTASGHAMHTSRHSFMMHDVTWQTRGSLGDLVVVTVMVNGSHEMQSCHVT